MCQILPWFAVTAFNFCSFLLLYCITGSKVSCTDMFPVFADISTQSFFYVCLQHIPMKLLYQPITMACNCTTSVLLFVCMMYLVQWMNTLYITAIIQSLFVFFVNFFFSLWQVQPQKRHLFWYLRWTASTHISSKGVCSKASVIIKKNNTQEKNTVYWVHNL